MGRRASRTSSELDGYVVVDKPSGATSHDVVALVRRVLHQPRAGHAGTLDPDATGVLVVGLGRGTRLMRFATALAKSYSCEVVLGTSTSTLDASGEITGTFMMDDVTVEQVQAAAAALTGRIAQVPPMVSAVKVGGRRLHELAREGRVVEREPRAVEVTRFDVAPTSVPGVYRAQVDCSSGTYVRVLAADLGEALGGGAHLRALVRTAVGPFRVEDAVDVTRLARSDVAPLGGLVAHLAQVVVDEETAGQVRHGKVLDCRALASNEEGPWALNDLSGTLLAVYEAWDDQRAKPMVVLASDIPAGLGASAGRPPGRARAALPPVDGEDQPAE